MGAREERIEAYYQESARFLAKRIVDLEDELAQARRKAANTDREAAVAQKIAEWPEGLQASFWSAVNAPTYGESAANTLAFSRHQAHELAQEIRREGGHSLCHYNCHSYDASLIDPGAPS